MKRWWILGVVGVLGIGLAVLLVPSLDTGGDTPERAQRLPRIKGKDVPEITGDEDWHPDRKRPGARTQDGSDGTSEGPRDGIHGSNPVAGMHAEARSTPEIQTLTRVTSGWVQINRLLLGSEDDPLTPALAERSTQLVRDLRDARRDPYDVDYAEFVRRQQELMGLIRQTQSVDTAMEEALARVDTILRAYEGQELNQTP